MGQRTIGSTPGQEPAAAQRAAHAGEQATVPASLLAAVMDVDAAVDDGGLELQDALARMHEELAHVIPGPAAEPGVRTASAPPASPEHSSSRS